MERPREQPPAPVPPRAKQAGEAEAPAVAARRVRWVWTQPTVWTDRRLTALDNGVQGNVCFSLIDKVHSPENLLAAWAKVRANDGAAGVDRQSTVMFEKHAPSADRPMNRRAANNFRATPISSARMRGRLTPRPKFRDFPPRTSHNCPRV